MPSRPLRLCLFGAPWDTGNRGVEALGRSAVAAIARSAPGSAVTVFDNGWGLRAADPPEPGVRVALRGVRQSRRYYRPESWSNVRVSQRLGSWTNPVARSLRRSDAVLDVSGGDSFSDIYGRGRFASVMQPKLAALRARRPLVLLPQTYGPFSERASRKAAARVALASALAYSRDAGSHAVLQDLLGDDYDAQRHVAGVDMAFALDPCEPPTEHLTIEVADLLAHHSRDRPLVGINVSGLVWETSGNDFGLHLDYAATVTTLVERLAGRGVDVLLVPHVRDVSRGRESDITAAQRLMSRLSGNASARVVLLPDTLNAREVKWVISTLDWFCGTRMHATIAGLSSQVPTAGIAYSMKTRGVFATCGVENEVVDARSSSAVLAVDALVDAFERREQVARVLRARAPTVVARARSQMSDICAWVGAHASADERAPVW